MTKCTHCCGTGLTPEADLEERVESLRSRCTELGHVVFLREWVTTNTAAALLNRAPGTIRNWLHQDRPLQPRKLHGRITYKLGDIAKMLIDAENSFD